MLDASRGGRIFTAELDGSNRSDIVSRCRTPDGLVVDVTRGHIYWTNMGIPSVNDGSIERAGLNGENRTTIVPQGVTFTPKQLQLELKSRRLYWCDREGMRVMRCDLDGANVETLVQTGDGEEDRRDETRWCVGVAVDPERGHLYWTQKGPSDGGRGRILRADLEMPEGGTPIDRDDIEVLFGGLPEPIDLELDLDAYTLYWTDRGDPPKGNSVNRARMDRAYGHGDPPEILSTHLMEGIGIALDLDGARMFVTDLSGDVYIADLNGHNRRTILAAQGNLTGIAYARWEPGRTLAATATAPAEREPGSP